MSLQDDLNESNDLIKEINEALKKTIGVYESLEGLSAKEREGQEKNLQTLKEQIKVLRNRGDVDDEILENLEKQLQQARKLNDELKKQYTARGRIFGEFSKEFNASQKFIRTQAAVYNYSEKIAQQYRDIQKSAGLSREQTRALGASFRNALPQVLAMGGEMGDIRDTFDTLMQESGRRKFFDADEMITVNAIAQATKMLPQDAAKMAESFELMGTTVDTMNETLADVYVASQNAGLNATKVIKTLQTNIKQMSSFSFVKRYD